MRKNQEVKIILKKNRVRQQLILPDFKASFIAAVTEAEVLVKGKQRQSREIDPHIKVNCYFTKAQGNLVKKVVFSTDGAETIECPHAKKYLEPYFTQH